MYWTLVIQKATSLLACLLSVQVGHNKCSCEHLVLTSIVIAGEELRCEQVHNTTSKRDQTCTDSSQRQGKSSLRSASWSQARLSAVLRVMRSSKTTSENYDLNRQTLHLETILRVEKNTFPGRGNRELQLLKVAAEQETVNTPNSVPRRLSGHSDLLIVWNFWKRWETLSLWFQEKLAKEKNQQSAVKCKTSLLRAGWVLRTEFACTTNFCPYFRISSLLGCILSWMSFGSP